jgi:hypothetical protein
MRQDGPTNLPLFFIKEKYLLALLELEVPDGPIPSIVLRMLYCFWKIRVALLVVMCSQALVYVSTAYSQCPRCVIREPVYPVPLDYRQIFEGNLLDEETAKRVW